MFLQEQLEMRLLVTREVSPVHLLMMQNHFVLSKGWVSGVDHAKDQAAAAGQSEM